MRKRITAITFLFLLSGCGYDDGNEMNNCKWVRFIPEQGESYYQYVCDDRSDLVRISSGDSEGAQ